MNKLLPRMSIKMFSEHKVVCRY